jgi:hypothetical protein
MTYKPAKGEEGVMYTELYGGKVIHRFHEKGHMHYISRDGGKKFVRKGGVTGIIGVMDKSKPLMSWQQNITLDFLLDTLAKGGKIDEEKAIEAVIQSELFLEQAADIGHEIHGWCEAYIRHQLKQKGFEKMPEIPNFPEAITGVNSFLAWVDEHKVKFLSTERAVYSMRYDYIGIMDFEAVIDGAHCMGDFKSSNGLYNSVRMQTVAYSKADEEERTKFKGYDGRYALRLSKYSEEEYMKRETRKKEIKAAVAKFKGSEPSTYPIKPYQVFEAVFLDSEDSFADRDFKAFLHCKAIQEWQKETDPFLNRELGGSL